MDHMFKMPKQCAWCQYNWLPH